MLIDALVHPRKKLDSPNAKIAIVLSVACTLLSASDASAEAQLNEIKSVVDILLEGRDMCFSIRQNVFGLSSLEEARKLCGLVKVPVVSAMVLRWISCTLADDDVYINDLFYSLLPIFLQLLQEISLLHALQRPECFTILKTIVLHSCGKGVDSSMKTNAKSCCIDCLIALMVTGFTTLPMDFLVKTAPVFEASVTQHMLISLLDAIQAPFSPQFCRSVRTLLALDCCRNVFTTILSSKQYDAEWKEKFRRKRAEIFVPANREAASNVASVTVTPTSEHGTL